MGKIEQARIETSGTIGTQGECVLGSKPKVRRQQQPRSKEKVECDECGKYLSRRSLLEHKKAVHRGEKKLRRGKSCRVKVKCDECGKYLSEMKALLNHKSLVHRGENPISCKVNDCLKRLSSDSKLGDHMRKEHGFPKLKCKIEGCESEFSSINEFRRHQYTHQDQTLAECEECGKRLIPKSLKKHKKLVHQKVTPVECEVEDCGKQFNRKSHLADHMRMVHGFPKLKCTECTAEFMSESVLVKHRRGHSKVLE